jgi:malonyl-CoA/methylmalonyl-CoA synthetase
LDFAELSRPFILKRKVTPAPAPDRKALASIVFTSGTTGAPKGAVLTHANLLAGTEALVAAWRWDASDRLVHTLPIFHAHGLCVGVFGTLLSGGSAVLLGRFDPVSVEEACRWHHASLFFGVPTMYHRLVDAPQGRVLGRLRLAVSGSAPLAADLHRRLSRQVGIDVLERYGMTETLMTVSNPVEGERRPGTVGFPLPGVEVRLAPAVAGGASSAPAVAGGASTQPRGAAQILVRGPGVFAGYWDRPVANAEAFSDGWFYTGDLGAVDDAGYLRILGRSTELIISGGFNVYPAEVEEVLAAHPAVAEVAVTGTPSDEWGEVVTAWVVPAVGSGDDALVADLVQHAATRLSAYKRPRLVRFVEELPRTALGKVQRGALA